MINIKVTDGSKGKTTVTISRGSRDVANDLLNLLQSLGKAIEEQESEFVKTVWVLGLEAMLPNGIFDTEKFEEIGNRKLAGDGHNEVRRS